MIPKITCDNCGKETFKYNRLKPCELCKQLLFNAIEVGVQLNKPKKPEHFIVDEKNNRLILNPIVFTKTN